MQITLKISYGELKKKLKTISASKEKIGNENNKFNNLFFHNLDYLKKIKNDKINVYTIYKKYIK